MISYMNLVMDVMKGFGNYGDAVEDTDDGHANGALSASMVI